MNRKVVVISVIAATACAPQHPRRAAAPLLPPSPIDTLAIRGYTRFLSDDALAGRATGTREADLAALYIQSACMGIGFAPITSQGYQQPVSLERMTIKSSGTSLTLGGPRGTRLYDYRAGFVPNMGMSGGTGFSGPAVYVGTSDDVTSGRLGSLDLRGAIAVISGPVPDPVDDTLHARGARALLQMTGDESQYLLYVRSRGDSRLSLVDTTTNRSLGSSFFSIVASPRLSRELVADIPLDRPSRLADSVMLRLSIDQAAVTSSNVGCVLEGADPKARDTAIAFTAHYDHLGIGIPDARGDSIYNGFSDNAAGVAMLLAIGDALTNRLASRPRHSILLLFFTGEEEGLLGSDYYVGHPLWPLARTRGVINLDAGAPPARPWTWRIAGGNPNSALGRLAQDVAAERGWSATTSAATPNSDYFPFHRSGVPAIFIVPGSAPYQGLTADSSQALRRRWDHYHEPGDEWAASFPFAGLGRYAEYAYLIGRALDAPLRPARADFPSPR
jgi:hypothetical protein